jgi:hypothetical protein
LINPQLNLEKKFSIKVKEVYNMKRERLEPEFNRRCTLSSIRAGISVSREELENYIRGYIGETYPSPWYIKKMQKMDL